MTTTYDSRVWDLAELFLSDEGELNNDKARHHLAAFLQDAIEGEIQWMRDHKADYNQG